MFILRITLNPLIKNKNQIKSKRELASLGEVFNDFCDFRLFT